MKLQGKGIGHGVALGTLVFWQPVVQDIRKRRVEETGEEIKRFHMAKEAAVKELSELYEAAVATIGEESALVFEIHQMMLEDPDYIDTATDTIRMECCNAEYAAHTAAEACAAMLAATGDTTMMERAADVRDAARRVIALLTGEKGRKALPDGPFLLGAHDLSPSETAQLDRKNVLGFALEAGAENSHTAILARAMGIPAVISLGEGRLAAADGVLCCMDGGLGELVLDPDAKALEAYREKSGEQARRRKDLEAYRGKPTRTKSGRPIELAANIGTPADLPGALANGAEAIGLFRSEFLFLQRDTPPDEETQYEAYKTVAESMGGKKVVIRTMDIGADKRVDYLALPQEENPALGLRGLRLSLQRPELFKTQLRALYRASAHGNVCILLPMVNSLEDVRRAKEMADRVRQELMAEYVEMAPSVPMGVMIETPAAALLSGVLAEQVDFFSIGTNDLTQYTLAVDRQSGGLDEFCDPRSEAVLRLVEMSVENAHQKGLWVGICGELAADRTLIKRFVEMGIDELSMVPAAILPMRKAISETE